MFIYVYRLAIDARPKWGDGVTGRKCPSLLEDFQTGVASMTRKRHLASIARGLLCFCLTTNIHEQLRPIRPIRGNKTSHRTGTLHQSKDIVVAPEEPILYCKRQLFCFVVFRLPAADQTGGEVQTGKLACIYEHNYLAVRA